MRAATPLPNLTSAAEPFGPLAATLAAGTDASQRVAVQPSVAFSTASPVGTFQGLSALRSSAGASVAVPDDDVILTAQQRVAAGEGLYLEASS